MKLISAEEYDALMAFIAPKLQSLWEHENKVRENNGQALLDSFQFGFPIVDIFHYLLPDEKLDFYLIFNETFLHIIYNQLLEAMKKYPDNFGTGNADDVLGALYEVSNYKPFGDIKRYIG